jgi:hypothetical protein
MKRLPYYGLLAEFSSVEDLIHAARETYRVGYRRFDGHTPFPVEGLADAMGFRRTWVPQLVFVGGVAGALFGYLMQLAIHVYDYPINVGGRPYHSAPSFIPVTFECTILAAALTTVLGLLLLNGLPMPYHPIFNVPRFTQASHNSFFLSIEARDGIFDMQRTRQFLASVGAKEVFDIEN